MKNKQLIGIPLVAICMVGGPPAAEMLHENKNAGEHQAVVPGSHEHPLEDFETTHMGLTYQTAFTTSSPNLNVVSGTTEKSFWPAAFFSEIK